MRQLDSAARNIRHGLPTQAERRLRPYQIAGLVNRAISVEHLARQDERPGLLARRRQPLLDQREVGAHPDVRLGRGRLGRGFWVAVARHRSWRE